MTIPVQRPSLPAASIGVLQARQTPPAPRPAAAPATTNLNLRERPIASDAISSGAPPRRGSLVNILA